MSSGNKLIAGTAALAILAGGGAAFAAFKLTESHSAASPAAAAPGRIDGFGLDGRFGGRGLGGGLGGGRGLRQAFGFGGEMAVATTYIGISIGALQASLSGGRSLAQIAKAHGKPVDGLVTAITAEFTKRLNAAVSAGQLTKPVEQRLQSHLPAVVMELVNGTRLGVPFHRLSGASTFGSAA